MAKHEQRRFTRVFHTIVAVVILLAGGAALGFGIWLSVSKTANASKLEYGSNSSFRAWLMAPKVTIGVGIFLIATALVSLIALTKQCVGKAFRVLYVLMAIVVLLVLAAFSALSVFMLLNRHNESVRDFVRVAWVETVKTDPDTVCELEKVLQCKGFDSKECEPCIGLEDDCGIDVCAPCGVDSFMEFGCYEQIIQLQSVFLPTAIVAGVLAAILLMDICFTLCM